MSGDRPHMHRSEAVNGPGIVGDNNQVFYGPTTFAMGPPARLLNKAQAERAIKLLTPFAGSEALLAFVGTATADQDIALVVRQLESIFLVSGWELGEAQYGDVNALNDVNPAVGIHLAAKHPESDLGKAFLDAFTDTPVGRGARLSALLAERLVRGPVRRGPRRPGQPGANATSETPPFPPVAILVGHRR